MEWRCPRCRHHKALVNFSSEAPEILGCVECNWETVLGDVDDSRPERCTSATSRAWHGMGGRCGQGAVVGGRCWRHAKDDQLTRSIYRYFRDLRDYDLPLIYRVVFDQALRNARIVIADEQHSRRLRERAAEVRVEPVKGPSVVYFVEREELIKIGVTTNLDSRLKAISGGSCMPPGMTVGPVTLLAVEPGDRTLEQQLHRKFERSRAAGEWFRPSRALRTYIDDLNRLQANPGHFLRRIAAA